jgi:hypothetical protein
MPLLPLTGPSYDLLSRPASVQRTVNLMPVPIEPGNERVGWVLKDVPGLTEFEALQPPEGLNFILLSNFEAPDSNTDVTDESVTGNDPVVYSDTHVELQTRITANQPKFGSQSWEVNYQVTTSFANRVLVYESDEAYAIEGAFTLAYWVWPDGIFSQAMPDVICAGDSPDGDIPPDISFGMILVDGEPYAYLNDGAYTAATSGLTPALVNAGAWNHVEQSRDDAGVMRCFLNGVKVVEQAGLSGTLTARNIIVGGYKKTTILPNVYSGGGGPKFYDSIAIIDGLCLHTDDFTPPTVPYTLDMTLEQARGEA